MIQTIHIYTYKNIQIHTDSYQYIPHTDKIRDTDHTYLYIQKYTVTMIQTIHIYTYKNIQIHTDSYQYIPHMDKIRL
jgi:hypothetical protein